MLKGTRRRGKLVGKPHAKSHYPPYGMRHTNELYPPAGLSPCFSMRMKHSLRLSSKQLRRIVQILAGCTACIRRWSVGVGVSAAEEEFVAMVVVLGPQPHIAA